MYSRFFLIVALWAFICSSSVAQYISPAIRHLDEKLQGWVDSGYYNGVSIQVFHKNKPFFSANYGDCSSKTVVNVASAGKWVVSATLAAIVDKGLMSWSDPVKKYLPQFRDTRGEATLSELLSHTSGFMDYQPTNRKRDDYQSLAEAVNNIFLLPVDSIPGTKFKYGGLSMQIAGRMAEIATGKNWESLFQEYIAIPLNMKSSHFIPVSTEPGFNPMLAGGFKTSMDDYIRFLEMISHYGKYHGKNVLSRSSVLIIESDQIKDAKIASENYVLRSRQNKHDGIYGLGVWREEIDSNRVATLVSSPGWAGAYPWVDRKNNSYGFMIAKVKDKAAKNGFSSFYGSAVLPLIVREAFSEKNYLSEMKYGMIDIGQAQLYYEEMGKGETVIFLHGHSLDHRMWDEQFFELAKSYHVIRYDMRGYGYSSSPQEGKQFTHVEDLKKLMDVLGVKKAHIVGLSLGGYVGTDLLGWFPERVLSAVLASGNIRPLPKPSLPMTDEEAHRREHEIGVLKIGGIDRMKREWFESLMRSGGTRKEVMRTRLWAMIYQWDAWQALHKEPRVIAGDDAYDQLKINKPKMPVLILEGRLSLKDNNKRPEILQYLPMGKLKIVEDAGHMLNMEQSEEFNRLLINFLSHTIDE